MCHGTRAAIDVDSVNCSDSESDRETCRDSERQKGNIAMGYVAGGRYSNKWGNRILLVLVILAHANICLAVLPVRWQSYYPWWWFENG